MICSDFSLIFLSIFINFYKSLLPITNRKNYQKKIKNVTSKKLLKITFLKKNQKFNIKKLTTKLHYSKK